MGCDTDGIVRFSDFLEFFTFFKRFFVKNLEKFALKNVK